MTRFRIWTAEFKEMGRDMMKRIISILLLVVMLSSVLEAFAAFTYNDITDEHWAAEYVKILTNRGILFGTPEGKILPDDNITRAEISAMISRTYDSDEYVDLSKQSFDDIQGHWAKKDVERLVDKDIILAEEYGESFHPDVKLTRIEMIRYVLRWLKLSEQADNETGNTVYNDDYSIAEKDKGYIKLAAKYGIISGYPDNTVRPYGKITRGEVFKIFCEAWNIYITGEETPAPTESVSPSPTPKRTGGSSGGSSSRKAVVDFAIPETAHTDTQLEVVTKNSYVKSLELILRKYDAEINDYSDVPLDEYIDGTMSAEGGAFKFKSGGKYRLCAVAENSRGRKYEYAKDITVYDVMNLSVQAVETTHTDTEIQITSSADKPLSDCSQKWSIAFDGEAVEDLSEYIDGDLNGSNNTVKLIKSGIYEITYTVTDAAGREFTNSKTIKVYPTAGITLSAPQSAMSGEDITVNAASDLTLSWYIQKDNVKKSYSEYAAGVLSDKGGVIHFEQAGTYTLCAVGADETGREFTAQTEIRVYAVPSLAFGMPEVSHTDKDISVTTDFRNTDGLSVKWYVCRNATGYKEYNTYIDGELSIDGGSIRFKDEGVYALKAEVTNEIGRVYNYVQKITVYPVPELSFNTVGTVHTDIMIPVVQTGDLSGYNVRWYISKDGGERKPYSEYTDDTLDVQGGNIMLKQQGKYILTLCAEDKTGRSFEYSQNITVLPVAQIVFNLPSVAHTDTELEIAADLVNIGAADVKWTITKDAQEKDYADYADGTLNNNGGNIRFKAAGDYTVTARFKDAAGRGYEASKQIKVYSIPTVEYGENGLPSYAYTDTDIIIKPEISNLGSLNINWQINGKPYTEYVTGTLDNNGGTIRLNSKGH
ncbi:MAG: S-layer homology domain-containing protein [Hominilimicola sp.]